LKREWTQAEAWRIQDVICQQVGMGSRRAECHPQERSGTKALFVIPEAKAVCGDSRCPYDVRVAAVEQ